MSSVYRVGGAMPRPKGVVAKTTPIALIGVIGYVLWNQRERLNDFFQSLAAKPAGDAGATTEQVPADYDWNRPSVANSTAMAGPVNGAGETRGIDGGSMGTDLGTQGEGAL